MQVLSFEGCEMSGAETEMILEGLYESERAFQTLIHLDLSK